MLPRQTRHLHLLRFIQIFLHLNVWNCWVYSSSVAFSRKKFWQAKNLLKPEPERIEAFRYTVYWQKAKSCLLFCISKISKVSGKVLFMEVFVLSIVWTVNVVIQNFYYVNTDLEKNWKFMTHKWPFFDHFWSFFLPNT